MIHFRSPFLVRSSPGPAAASRRTQVVACFVFSCLAAILVLIWFLVHFRVLQRDATLYQLHDSIFLTAKGYLYTLDYPTSLGPLAFCLTLLLFVVFSLVSGVSLLTVPYKCLIKTVIGCCPHWAILSLARAFLKFPGSPQLALRLGSAAACESAILDFDIAEDAQRKRLLNSAARQASLVLELESIFGGGEPREPLALNVWTQVSARAVMVAGGNAEAVHRPMERLVKCLKTLFPGVEPFDLESWREASTQPAFSLGSIRLDILYVSAIWNEPLALELLRIDSEEKKPDQVPRGRRHSIFLARLASSTTARKELIDRLVASMESRAFETRQRRDEARASEADWPPEAGPASLDLALLVAHLAQAPSLFLGYLDAIDSLAFARGLLGGKDGFAPVAVLFDKLPRVQDFRFAAEMQLAAVGHREADWQRSVLRQGESLKEQDFKQARLEIRRMSGAAGIDLPEQNQTG